MAGFVLGDDPFYGTYAHMIIQGQYPPLCDYCVFAFRPILLLLVALSLKFFGWSEFSFVLPILISSLVSIYLIYELGIHFFDHATGLLSAAFLAVFPLDVVHATTLTNDIMLNMLLALSLCLFLKAFERDRKQPWILFALSGTILGISMGVKTNSFPAVGLFVLIAIHKDWKQWRFVKGMIVFLGSWLAVQSFFMVAYYLATGDLLAQIHAELNFTFKFNPAGYINTAAALKYALLYYPSYMLGLAKEGYYGYQFYPYGFFYPVLLLALAYLLLIRRDATIVVPLMWLSFLFLLMEFTPVRVFPYYEPTARLFLYLSIITMPSLLIIAHFVRRLFSGSLASRLVAVFLVCGLIVTSIDQACRKSYFYRDCMKDARVAYDLIKNLPYVEIITDYEMKSALSFYSQYRDTHLIKSFEYDKPQYVEGSLVLLGGSRRLDIDPRYLERYLASIPTREKWSKLYEVRGNHEVWRFTDLVIYRINRMD